MVKILSFRGATIAGERIYCTCKRYKSKQSDVFERPFRLELENAVCTVDIPLRLKGLE